MTPDNTNTRLPHSTPEAQGIPTVALTAFLDDVEEKIFDLHSVMVLRHGHVVAEGWWSPYAPDVPHMLYSLSKSFTSSAVGIAVDEGLLSIDDTVLSFFPDETPDEVNEHLAAMRVRHLLSMNTGHDEDTFEHLRDSADPNWARAFFATPVVHEPGTHFLYNSGATYILSAIIQKLTGQTLLDYLTPRLFEPLGIRNPTWQTCPMGIITGGWGRSITTEDIACFGQMLLQKGIWSGQRVLPEEWTAMAASFYSDNSTARDEIDWQQGYGFQYWLCRHNAYRGDGAFGQFCVIMPAQDAVFVTTAGVEDMQAVLDLVWKHLLPAMGPDALPEEPDAVKALNEQLGSLSLPACGGNIASNTESVVDGKTFSFEPNQLGFQSLKFGFEDNACIVTVGDGRGEHRIHCGRGEWRLDEADLQVANNDMMTSKAVAAATSWIDDRTLIINLCLYETPHIVSLSCRFEDDRVVVAPKINVSFSEEEIPTMEGRRV